MPTRARQPTPRWGQGKAESKAEHKRLYDRQAWRKGSKAYLIDHPLCVECEKQGKATAATCVDHIVPHRGNEVLFASVSNWQGLCDSCHGKKTARGQ